MDFNSLLLPAQMLYGRYDTQRVHYSKLRIAISCSLAFVEFFCGIKMFVIIIVNFLNLNTTDIVLYLVEFYIVDSHLQNYFYVAVALIHMAIGFIFLYWGWLCANPTRMRCLDHLFTPDIHVLCLKYNLNLKLTKRFLWRVGIYQKILRVVVIGFETSFLLLIGRCMFLSYLTIPFQHFLYIALPMSLLTICSYFFLGLAFLITYLLALITLDFLGLRAKTLSEQIRKKFRRTANYRPALNRLILLKQKKDMSELLSAIDDIVQQFKASNQIFDSMISATFTSSLLGGLLFPSFLFLNISIYFKCIAMFLYALAILNNCFLIIIFNERFITNVSGSPELLDRLKFFSKIRLPFTSSSKGSNRRSTRYCRCSKASI